MNRFMVWLGCTIVFLTWMFPLSPVHAEMPRVANMLRLPKAATIRWHDSLDSGWNESRRRNLPMVIFITTEPCRYCDAMKRDTWCERSVLRRIAGSFVAIRLTPHRNSSTLNRIDVKTYPTTLVGIPEGKIVGHRTGYQPPAALHGLLSDSETASSDRH